VAADPAPGWPGTSAWALDPDVSYLNHGGFGATPRCVQADQLTWRTALERNPTGFLVHQLPELLDGVRREVADFLRTGPEGIVFVDNATTGTQTVIAQTRLGAGDEIVVTDHCYPAVLAQLHRTAAAAGAVLRVASVPVEPPSRSWVTEAVMALVSGRTRLVIIDHVASCSGLVFPVDQITAECRRLGVAVLIDGAHAPGQVPVDLDRLAPDFWVGNLHKWVCAPKATAALYAAPRWRDQLLPLVGSHRLTEGYQAAFDWTGTRDPSALLSVPAALRFFAAAGWPAIWAHNNALARQGAALIAKSVGTAAPDPPDGMAAAMRLAGLPWQLTDAHAKELERRLLEQERVVVPVTSHAGAHWLRVSAQLYNSPGDYERLADALLRYQRERAHLV